MERAASPVCPPDRFPAAVRAVHWMTVVLLAAVYPLAWLIDDASTRQQAALLLMLHRSFGVAILLLTATRIVLRLSVRTPPLPGDLPQLQRLAARATMLLLYGLLLAQPLLGLVASMLRGKPVILFGSLVLPAILPVDRALAHRLIGWHGTVAIGMLVVAGLHAAAALHHHFIRRDGVLASMLPGLAGPDRRPAAPDPRLSL